VRAPRVRPIDRAVDRKRPAVVRVRLEGEDAGPFGEHPGREQAVETDVSPSIHDDAVGPQGIEEERTRQRLVGLGDEVMQEASMPKVPIEPQPFKVDPQWGSP
jgi:hypothetical protein